RYNFDVIVIVVVVILLMVQMIQWLGDMLSRMVDHR
ncbi:UNVERIFIED_CONTAM: metal ABC transporter permease, partial [Bacillus subtilis]